MLPRASPLPALPLPSSCPGRKEKNQSCAGFMHPAFPALRTRGGGAASVPAGTGIYKKLCKADPSKKIRFRVGFQTRPLQGGQDLLLTPGSQWSLVLQRDRHRAPRSPFIPWLILFCHLAFFFFKFTLISSCRFHWSLFAEYIPFTTPQ